MTGERRPPATYGPLGNVQQVLGRGDLTLDAWGRPKFIQDLSLFHGMFTFNIPATTWYESIDGVEQTSFTAATSVNSKLNLTSSSNTVKLQSFRNPRYQPNRGFIYSNSLFLPDPDATGTRDFGLFTAESGVFFRLRDGILYAVRRSGIGVDIEEEIELPRGLDLSKGNIFDIQGQWRGVGNIYFYIGDPKWQASRLVHIMEHLNTSTELSFQNPALPIAFECTGTATTIECGCVDLSTEGGQLVNRTYGSLSTSTESGSVDITGFNQPILAVRSNKTFLGRINTRDIQNLSILGYANQRCVLRVWITRDETALSLGTQTWTQYRNSPIDYLEHGTTGTPPSLDTAKATLQYAARIDQDQTFVSSALFEKATELFLTPGDILIFTIHRENGISADVGVTYEFAEEI